MSYIHHIFWWAWHLQRCHLADGAVGSKAPPTAPRTASPCRRVGPRGLAGNKMKSGDCGWLLRNMFWIIMECHVWMIVDHCGLLLWIIYGLLWMIMDDYGLLWIIKGHCRLLWIMDGCGWLRIITDWLKGKIAGNHGFPHQYIGMFPVKK